MCNKHRVLLSSVSTFVWLFWWLMMVSAYIFKKVLLAILFYFNLDFCVFYMCYFLIYKSWKAKLSIVFFYNLHLPLSCVLNTLKDQGGASKGDDGHWEAEKGTDERDRTVKAEDSTPQCGRQDPERKDSWYEGELSGFRDEIIIPSNQEHFGRLIIIIFEFI